MSREFMMRFKHRGIGLAAALFLLLIIGGLVAFLLTLSSLQHSSSALDVQGSRAFRAARAGIEWGVYRSLQVNNCAASASFGLAGILSDFTVTITCVDTPYTEVDATVRNVYAITATACNRPAAGVCPGAGGTFYVERQLQALVDKVN